MANGWGADHPGPGSYPSALQDAELIVRRINAGVDGFNRWSLLNRGDLDGQWQFIDTWDRKTKKLLREYTPHPNTYFVLGPADAVHGQALGGALVCKVEGGKIDRWQRVFAAALRSPGGNLTLAVVNDAPSGYKLALECADSPRGAAPPLRRHGEAAGPGRPENRPAGGIPDQPRATVLRTTASRR